jgi:xanthine dehydrogenase YagS FAD-binding subunit
MLKDMMSHFELYQPTDVDNAFDLLDRFGEDCWTIAGGHDSLGWFKDRGKAPSAVIDLAGIAELHGIRETTGGGIELGAMTTLTEVERHPVIQERFGLIAEAARMVASPQIRNSGTMGGNVVQDTRCWYYRFGLACYRAGGNTCYASAPEAMNREHAIFGASRCVAVSPSDPAPALVALAAEMVIRNSGGERVVSAEDFFMTPAVDIQRMTVLHPEDLLTTIRIPDTWAGANFYFEKVADRGSWDFPLVNVASALRIEGGQIADARIVVGAVACVPRRLRDVEDFVRGRVQNEETANMAGAMAIEGAEPLRYNGFKVPLMENLVKRAVRDA